MYVIRDTQEKKKDILLALGLLAVGVVALIEINATTEQSRIVSAQALTYATMPSIYAWLLIGLVGLFIGITIRDMRADRLAAQSDQEADTVSPEEEEMQGDVEVVDIRRKTILLRTFGTLIALLAYVLLLKYVHFMILTTLFLFVMFLLFGQRSIKKIAVISICGGAVFYFLFVYLLKLPL